jgi:hypothetical protein
VLDGLRFCVGGSQSPHSGAVSVRANNRNFEGRSGTKDAKVYLVSPESAVAAALTGKITDPRDLGMDYPSIPQPERFFTDADMFVQPTGRATVYRGPAMGLPPSNTAMPADSPAPWRSSWATRSRPTTSSRRVWPPLPLEHREVERFRLPERRP